MVNKAFLFKGGFQKPFYGIRPLRGDPFEAIWARHHLGHWYKSYSGGRWTWPTPLKSPESKFKYTEAKPRCT